MVLITYNGRNERTQFNVSVPLRGLWFLSKEAFYKRQKAAEKFPSPYGDYGSYQQEEGWSLNEIKALFPSPYGDYGSYLMVMVCMLSYVPMKFPSPYGDYGSYRLSGR